MNCNLESARILSAVDDTYAELLFLSRLTRGVEEKELKIAGDALASHVRAYTAGDTHALRETTLRLCRWMKHDRETVARIAESAAVDDASPEFAELTRSFNDARERLAARLTRTAEHAARRRDAFEQVLRREQNQREEKVALQNQLLLETAERVKKIEAQEDGEAKTRSELAVVAENARRLVRAFADAGAEAEALERCRFEGEVEACVEALTKTNARLREITAKHKTEEASLRKRVSDAEKKLHAKLTEYDLDVSSVRDELRAAQGMYESAAKTHQDYVKDAETFKNEREREEALRRRKETASENRRDKILDNAAAVIQLAWLRRTAEKGVQNGSRKDAKDAGETKKKNAKGGRKKEKT